MPLALSLVVFFASAEIVAYLSEWFGLRIVPLAVLAASALAAAGTLIALTRYAASNRDELIGFASIVAGMLAWLLGLAWPSYLPLGSGPDLTHHLALIDFIERCWCLPHDANLGAALGEMASYTPGVHLLAALAGAWSRSDGLHTIYLIVAVTVALKAGFVFLVARRLMPDRAAQTAWPLAAVLLLFGPRDYFIGSFAEASYLAQVASELFAVAMWLSIVVWNEHPSTVWSTLIALFATATFLTWPVALGPPVLLALLVIAFRPDLTLIERGCHLAIVMLLPAGVAALHALGRTGAAVIIGGAGYVAYPHVDLFGWWFLLPAAAGVIVAAFDRRSRTVSLLMAGIALQSIALLVVANRSGAARPYMALKMVYLAIYPMAVAGSLALARAALLAGRSPAAPADAKRVRWPRGSMGPSIGSIVAWAGVAALAFTAVRSAVRLPRPRPAVSQTLFLAGEWARARMKPACIDYVVDNVYSAYWLHIAVLRNGRAAPRSTDDDTYLPEKERIRWVMPDGLPYAIAQDFDGLPRDIRANVDVLARFGSDAVMKRRGRAACADPGPISRGQDR